MEFHAWAALLELVILLPEATRMGWQRHFLDLL